MVIVLLIPGCQVWPNSVGEDALEVSKSLLHGVDALARPDEGTGGYHQAIYMVKMGMSNEKTSVSMNVWLLQE